MPSQALRQADLFEEPPQEVQESGVWAARLAAAFDEPAVSPGFLPLTEEALKACPGDPEILLMAATAALLDGRPERALVFLKRFSKRAEGPAAHLLRALALNLTNKRDSAQVLLKRHGFTSWMEAYPAFPAGREHLEWLIGQIGEIMGPVKPATERGRAPHAGPKGKKAPAGRKAKPALAPKRGAEDQPR